MPRHLSEIVWSITKACGLLAGLAACAPPPAYFAEQLERVPTPAPALMARTTAPDCRVYAARTSKPTPVKPKAAATDFEAEPTGSEMAVAPDAADTSEPGEDELQRLAQERDCYRRAEQLARNRLDALQASSAQTVVALDRIRSEVPAPDTLPGW